MITTTTTAIEQQSLSYDYIYHLIESDSKALFKVLNSIEVELESILANEFEQGLVPQLAGY